ncbi:MAG: nucleoside deaminase [Bacteroidetes bacterium]|nr:nucleoside deaminase [Bacteroidota bacterium]
MLKKDTFFMKEALKQAERAAEDGEIPVGAVVVCEGQVISRAFNQVELLHDPTAHAEMIAITSAAGFLNSKYLEKCTLYVTLEPCPMCRGAIAEAHIGKVVFGTYDNSPAEKPSQTKDQGGVLEEECKELIDEFFNKLRSK